MIAVLLAEAERRWGRGALVRWGDAIDPADVEVIPTGFAELDEALGVGGLPCGRISEVFGPDSSGKQALVASLAVQCQKAEGVVAWIDPARRLDPEQMRVQGVDFGSLLVARPETGLQALEMAIRLARSGGVKLLVFDLGVRGWGMGDRDEQVEGRVGEGAKGKVFLPVRSSLHPPSPIPHPPTHHSALGLALRRLVAAVDRNHIAFVFVSDVPGSRVGPGAGDQSPRPVERRLQPVKGERLPESSRISPAKASTPRSGEDPRGSAGRDASEPQRHAPSQHSALSTQNSTGGQALRYFASVRLEMERREWIRRGREVVGCRAAVRVVKNKLAPPLREAEVPLLFYRFPPQAPTLPVVSPRCNQTSLTRRR